MYKRQVMMFVLTGTQSAYAGTDNKTYVIDDAGILTSEEEQKLTMFVPLCLCCQYTDSAE